MRVFVLENLLNDSVKPSWKENTVKSVESNGDMNLEKSFKVDKSLVMDQVEMTDKGLLWCESNKPLPELTETFLNQARAWFND